MSISRLMQMGAAGAGGDQKYSIDTSSGGLDILSVTNSDFGTGDFTLEAWIYVSGSLSTYNAILGHAFNAGGGILYARSDGSLEFYEGGSRLRTTAGDFSTGTWTHVACVLSSGTLTIYVDGTSVGSAAYTRSITDTNIYVGQEQAGGNTFPGHIFRPHVLDYAKYTGTFVPRVLYYPESTTSLVLVKANKDSFEDLLLNSITNDGAVVSATAPEILTITDYSSEQSTNSTTFPADVFPGDIAFLEFGATSVSSISSISGWDTVFSDTNFEGTGEAFAVFVKVCDGTEGGTTVSSPLSGATDEIYRIDVVRTYAYEPEALVISGLQKDTSTTSASVTVTASSSDGPCIIYLSGFQIGSSDETRSVTRTADDSISNGGGGTATTNVFSTLGGYYTTTSGGSCQVTYSGTGANFNVAGFLLKLS